MRTINKIIVHCSATPRGRNVTVHDIRRWHIRDNRWKDIGYHYVIHLDGTVHPGRPLEKPGSHCKGHNSDSIGVCYVGGLSADGSSPEDTRTPEQRASLDSLLRSLRRRFPGAAVYGHNHFNPRKACPCFNINL